MKSSSARSLDTAILGALFALGIATIFSFTLMPHRAGAAGVTISVLTATSSPAFTTGGLASTTRARTGDSVRFQLNTVTAPLVSPQINISGMGSTTMTSGNGATRTKWYYSTSSISSAIPTGAIPFKISLGDAGGTSTTTATQASITSAPNVTFDKTGPLFSSAAVSWSDVDGSTQFSATDTLTFTFNETMATTTIATGNADARLGLSGSHTFGTTPTVSWNTPGTILTLTLGTSPTLATADTVQLNTSGAVKDAIGNIATTSSSKTITDNVAPGNPTGLTDTNFLSSINVSLASVGSSAIRYTIDGTTPACPSTGTLYSSAITFSNTTTLKAIGCDQADNASSVVTAIYTHATSGGGSSHGGGSSITTPAVPATPAYQLEGCQPGYAFNTLTGKSCTNPATPATPAVPGQGASAFAHATSRDLKMGSLGEDVRALQMFLNTHGFAVSSAGPGSSGNETTTFGALTRAAVIKYQKAKGIMPAVGYFGPLTRAAINAEK